MSAIERRCRSCGDTTPIDYWYDEEECTRCFNDRMADYEYDYPEPPVHEPDDLEILAAVVEKASKQ